MFNTPNDPTDSQLAQLLEDEMSSPRPTLNAETILGNKPLPEIDLRGRDIRFEYHGTFRGRQYWSCWDVNQYDGPESPMGSGESREDALVDLMDRQS